MATWRDGSTWLFPVHVSKVTTYYYEVVHNGCLKLSGINRTRLLQSAESDNAVDSSPTPESTLRDFVADELLYQDSDSDRDSEDKEVIEP